MLRPNHESVIIPPYTCTYEWPLDVISDQLITRQQLAIVPPPPTQELQCFFFLLTAVNRVRGRY